MEAQTDRIEVLSVIDAEVYHRLGRIIEHLCVGMVDEPARVTVLTLSAHDGPGETIGPSRLVRLPRRWFGWRALSADALLEALEIEPPDVVHCFSPDHAAAMLAWCEDWGSLLVTHLSDLCDVLSFAKLELAGKVVPVVPTRRVEEWLVECCPESRSGIRRVPYGVPAQPEPSCLAQPDRVPAVILTAMMMSGCGIEEVFAALQAIVRSGQELHLFALSSGPAEVTLRRMVNDLGLRACVTFAGPIRDFATLHEAIRSADFFIVPGQSSRFSIDTLSAMAGGLAVLAPAGTGEDYLVDGVTARLFDPSAPAQMARRWAGLLDDRSFARELGHGALDHVRAHHQASSMVGAIAALYRQQVHTGLPVGPV